MRKGTGRRGIRREAFPQAPARAIRGKKGEGENSFLFAAGGKRTASSNLATARQKKKKKKGGIPPINPASEKRKEGRSKKGRGEAGLVDQFPGGKKKEKGRGGDFQFFWRARGGKKKQAMAP